MSSESIQDQWKASINARYMHVCAWACVFILKIIFSNKINIKRYCVKNQLKVLFKERKLFIRAPEITRWMKSLMQLTLMKKKYRCFCMIDFEGEIRKKSGNQRTFESIEFGFYVAVNVRGRTWVRFSIITFVKGVSQVNIMPFWTTPFLVFLVWNANLITAGFDTWYQKFNIYFINHKTYRHKLPFHHLTPAL